MIQPESCPLHDSTIALEVETLPHYLAYDSTFILVLPRVQ
jgi:hypothetical protein